MQIRKNCIAVIIGLLLFPVTLQAQQNKSSVFLKRATKEYNALRYAATIELLKLSLKKDPEVIVAKEMMANSYRKIKDYDNAASWYAALTAGKDLKPEWALYYAEVLANQQKYVESEKWYQKYLSFSATDSRATAFVNAYTAITTLAKDQGLYKVSYTNINTASAEYSPAFYKNGLIFSSNRSRYDVTKSMFGWDQTPFSNLYSVEQLSDIKPVNTDSLLRVLRKDAVFLSKLYKVNDDDTKPTSNDTKVLGNLSMAFKLDTLGQFFEMKQIAKPMIGKVNTKLHEGSAVELPDGSIMFTRNNIFNGKTARSEDKINKLKLFTASGDNWETITNFPYNNDEYSVGHPAVNKKGTLLIFSSDMPGGFGGVDLYYSKRSAISEKWGIPVNMGKRINTEGDEMFPSITRDSILYFASTGHRGLGGLDIFQVALKDEAAIGDITNLGAPINSSVDDFGLISTDDNKKGYFTSNRRGSDDIYSFAAQQPGPKKQLIVPIYALEGKVLDHEGQKIIPEAIVILKTASGEEFQTKTDGDGLYKFNLSKETDYTLEVQKFGYIKPIDGASVTTNGLIKSEVLKKDLYLTSIGVGKIFRIDNIYYDFDKYNIRPDAAIELNKLVAVLKEYPTIWIELGSHTDSRGSDKYNEVLSQNRANSAVAYIISKGINKERITAKGYGEKVLVNKCANGVYCSVAAHQLNRRTEFKITKQ